jgi:hypothetical protein
MVFKLNAVLGRKIAADISFFWNRTFVVSCVAPGRTDTSTTYQAVNPSNSQFDPNHLSEIHRFRDACSKWFASIKDDRGIPSVLLPIHLFSSMLPRLWKPGGP